MQNILSVQRILLGLGVIAFVGAAAVGATGAFFNDTETSTGNTFAAGAIDLKIDSVSHYNGMVCAADGENYVWVPAASAPLDPITMQPVLSASMDEQTEWDAYNLANPIQYPPAGMPCTGTWPLADIGEGQVNVGTFFNFNDIKPGDEGENTISIHVENNDAWMCASLDNVAEADNGQNEPEAQDDVDADVGAELDSNLFFFAWLDDGDNVFEQGELPLGNPVAASTLADQTWALADSSTGDGPIQGDVTQYIGLYWCAGTISVVGNTLSCDGSTMNNASQTDEWTADISFFVEQSRNNEDFLCNRPTEPTTATLSLQKQVNQDGVDPVLDNAWTLSAVGAIDSVIGTDNDPNPSPAITNIVVEAGDYTLTESTGPAGFQFQGVQCTDGTLVGNVLTLAPGDNAVCTFTNLETEQDV